MAFAPLRAISDNAASIIERKRASLAADSERYPPGLRKQYELQLQLLENGKNPALELLVLAGGARPMTEPEKPYMALGPNVCHPWHRGTIVSNKVTVEPAVPILKHAQHITSTDPRATPHIDPHYLEDEFDLEILAEGFKYVRRVIETEPFKDLVKAQVLPPPDTDLSSDDKVKGATRYILPVEHWSNLFHRICQEPHRDAVA